MKILIVSATLMEVKLLSDEFILMAEKSHLLKSYLFGDIEIEILISGIGVTFTAFHLTETLKENSYDLVLNVGIAGSLTRELKVGEIVNVVSEEFADLGVEKNNEFLTLFESGFMDSNEFPFNQGIIRVSSNSEFNGYRKVRGITSSRSHGRKSSIDELNQKFSAHVETMEGAAVFYVCNWLGVPCYQIRAISNFVEPNDNSGWNIPIALENLKESILKVLNKLSVPVN